MTIAFDGRQCTAVHVTGVFRHGERYPGADDMEDMTTLQDKIIANKPENTFDFIETWTNTYPPAEEDMLVEHGREMLKGLGQRYRKRFDTLFKDTFETVELISSKKDRAKESATSFYSGLSGLETHTRTSVEDNALVRFYDDCEYYETRVEDNATALEEFHTFMESQTYINMRQGVEARLGFDNATLSDDEMELMYEMCAFEKYAFNRSQWCDFLEDTERAVMEYAKDLENYYEKSYGNDVSGRLACVLLDNIMSTLKQVADDHNSSSTFKNGRFMFGHSETLVPLYTAMGLFHDNNPLLASNMDTMATRQFKTSKIIPMAANIVFVLYACLDTATETKYAVKLFSNEGELDLPTCGASVCWLDDVRETYAEQTSTCDRDALCTVAGPTTPAGGATTVGRGIATSIPSTIVIAASFVAILCL